MAVSLRRSPVATPPEAEAGRRTALIGVAGALTLMAAAMLVPWLSGWNVHVFSFPPLHAEWRPRIGPGTVPAAVLAIAVAAYGGQLAARLAWPRLLVVVYAVSVTWLVSLATVDGWAGIGHILDTGYEYLGTARDISSLAATLHEFVGRISADSPHPWPVHVAGHPPGALLFFVALVWLGLGSGLAAGWVVLLLAATTPVAVLITLQRLGASGASRRAAPFLVAGPAAVWMAVSADAVFAAVAAWGICCMAISATSMRRTSVACWGVAAGLLFGYCVMLSYGLPLLALLALTVLVVARKWAPLPWVAGAAIAVVVAFALAGFSWWEAYPYLHDRYWGGVASRRPMSYWGWANVAALCFSAGPVLGASVALVGRQVTLWMTRRPTTTARDRAGRGPASPELRAVVALTSAAFVMVLLADLSGMSKAEVERIWLPFVPWLLVGTALLPLSLRRPALMLQLITALAIQHLLFTGWSRATWLAIRL